MPGTQATTGAVGVTLGPGTNTIGKVYITDGTDDALVSATGELSPLDTNSAAIKTAVQLIDDVVATDGAADLTKLLQVVGTDGTNAQIISVGADGKVNVADGGASLTVDGTFWQATQPVPGTFWQATQPVSGTFWQATQPVSATDLDIRNLAPATDEVKIGDGTDTLNITGDGRAETVVMAVLPDGTNNLACFDVAARRGYVEVTDGTTSLPTAVNTAAAKTAGIQMMAMYDATIPTAIADGYAVTPLADAYGVLQTTGHVGNAFRTADNQSTAQTNTALQAAPGANLSLYVTDIIISNGATAGNVKLVEDTAGTPLDILEVMYFAINGGCVINLQTPLKLTANKNLGYTSVSVTTHGVTVAG